MKKTLTLFFTLVTILGNAQDFSTFGLAANPGNLLQNPGADPMTRLVPRLQKKCQLEQKNYLNLIFLLQ